MALHQKREDRPNGGYSICVWDNDFGHAVIWEYDANDELQRRGIITHIDGPQGSSEAVWHDASGHHVRRNTT